MDKSTKNNNSRDITIGCGSDLQSSSQSQTTTSSSSPSSSTTTTTTSGKSQTPSIAPQSSQSTTAPISLSPASGIAGGGGGGGGGGAAAAAAVVVANSSLSSSINLHVTTTTGGYHVVNVDSNFSVENLKKVVAKKLKVAKDRICLLHRERELMEGNLKENGLVDGSKIILIPNVETGLLAQRPENTVMQALESLNDSQVNDFLSGKTPLNLSMRLGDHMMLIQLQLSTVHPSSPSHHGSTRSRSSQRCNRSSSSSSSIVVSNGNSSTSSINASNNSSNSTNSSTNTNSTVSINSSCTSTTCTSNSNSGHHHHYHHHHHHHHHRHHSQHQSHYHNCNNNGGNINGSSNGNATINGNSSNNVVVDCHSSPIKIVTHEKQESTAMISDKKPSEIVMNNDNKMEIEESNAKETTTNKKLSNSLSSTSFSDDSGILDDQSPIKSLSNLVSSPMKTTPINNIPINNNPFMGSSNSTSKTEMNSSSTVTNLSHSGADTVDGVGGGHISGEIANCNNSDPISAKLTSCLCKRLVNNAKNCGEANLCQATSNHSAGTETTSSGCCNPCVKMFPPLPPLLHKTQSNPIGRRSYRQALSYGNILRKMQTVACKRVNGGVGGSGEANRQTQSSSSTLSSSPPSPSPASSSTTTTTIQPISSSSSPSSSFDWSSESSMECDDETNPPTDSRALAEASRNLTQTLRKLSKEVFTNKVDFTDDTPRRTSTGAVIESMKSHGKGIYSGTFSGTLNPALQDRYGRPKRDISTVIHILNDLLSATPQYNRGAKISFEPSNSKSIKHTSSKYNNSTNLVQESCEKCSSGGNKCKTNTCAYGECNGHYNSKMPGTSSSIGNSSNICHQLRQQNASELVGGTAAVKSVVNCTCRSNISSVGTTTASTTETVAIRTESGMKSSSSIVTSKAKATSLEESNSSIGNSLLMGTNSSSGENRNSCTCSFRGGLSTDAGINGVTSILSFDSNNITANAGNICSKCSAEIENNKTKCKLDQLRLVMQQRKQKREARKSKVAPYEAIVLSNNLSTTATLANATASSANSSSSASSTATSTIAPLTSASEVSPNHLVEEVDTAA